MGAGSAYVLPPEFLVEPDGGVDVLHDHRRPGGEAATPLHVGRRVGSVVRGWGIVHEGGRIHQGRVVHEEGSGAMTLRRRVLAATAAGTLAAPARPRKPLAAGLPPMPDLTR